MTESLPSNEPGTQKRRSTRIVQAIPITVSGTDALGQPFKERTTTVMVNCHGCKYQSKHYVPKNSIVKLDIPQPEPGSKPKSTEGRVVWVQRPRTVRELFQIGLEFEVPGNAWGIAFPPEDWADGAVPLDYAGDTALPLEVAGHTRPKLRYRRNLCRRCRHLRCHRRRRKFEWSPTMFRESPADSSCASRAFDHAGGFDDSTPRR